MTRAERHATIAADALDRVDPQGADRHFIVQLAIAHALTALALDVTEDARRAER